MRPIIAIVFSACCVNITSAAPIQFLVAELPQYRRHDDSYLITIDLTIEILDGTPTMVEQDFSAWVANTGGVIGFWSYTVVAEIGAIPEPSTIPFMVMLVPCLMRRRPRPLSPSGGDASVIGDPSGSVG